MRVRFLMFLGIVLLAVLAFTRGIMQFRLPGELASIEVVRFAIAHVEIGDSEDVIGQAVKWNAYIARHQEYNRRWWADLFIPDAWDSVQQIELPSR